MAPKRRTATARTASNQQTTLTFSHRVTKPTTTPHDSKKAAQKTADLVEGVVTAERKSHVSPEPEVEVSPEPEPQPSTLPLRDPLESTTTPQTTESVLGGRAEPSPLGATGGQAGTGWVSDEEARARKLPEAQIKKYWREKEQARLAPRVHQEDLGLYEKVLREWDVSGEFGPCIGIARLKRWKRANLLGLEPPIEVLAVLLRQMDDGNAKGQRAYVDQLMSSHAVAEP